ncbi:MAG: tRNA (adenosine(37)-N6)-dimethylallyltransferase MiaA [Patescibacteria group bacterium]
MKKQAVKEKPLLVAIVGPNASGKSALAIRIAQKFNGEVISADSRQVYKGLDIGSGKVTKKEMRGVLHHLLSIADPKKIYSVAKYQKDSTKIIKNILNKNKLPIVCGGTGFYVDSILYPTSFPAVSPNKTLRIKLYQKSPDELYKILQKLDPRRAKTIDRNNPVRLIRAIEVAAVLGKVPALNRMASPYRVLFIGLKPSDKELRLRIQKRLVSRMKKGMVKEVRKLHKNGLSWKRLEELGLEYRFVAQYLQEKITKEEMVRYIAVSNWQYAKRQITWFKRNLEIKWFSNSGDKKIFNLI